MLLSPPDNHFQAKNLKYQLIPSRDIDDQRLMQSNWTKSTTGHTQPKVLLLDANFP